MSENKQTPDSELLLQIVGYNSDAFDQLYNRYSATIYSLIKEIVTNPKQAEKILLNVFSVFLKRIDYYSTTSNNIFTWLTLLARNISVDTLKRMKFVEDIPIYSDDYEIEFILPNLSQEISLINLDERNELSEKIKSYKSQLSEVQNLVLSLIYFEGLNEEEIAKRLNVTAATVRQKTLAIMENLYSQYTGHAEDAKINKEILNLAKLESLGCLTNQERILFNQIRNNDPDFLWKEYGEYQNLTALLAIAIPAVKPPHELNTELRIAFTKILQGSDVDYPIVASEISVVEPVINSIPEPLPEKVEIPKPEEMVVAKTDTMEETKLERIVEAKAEKNDGFHIKFRERDPKELSILRNLDNVDVNTKVDQNTTTVTATAIAKAETEIKFKSYQKIPVKKPSSFIDTKVSSADIKQVINAVINEDKLVQNKISSNESVKQNLEIENDDPSIIIEEPKPVQAKEEVVIKNRLIPNSSINLKEIFRKDNKPSNSKEINPVNAKVEKVVEEKPVVPVDNFDIKIKTNEPPKEFRKNSPFVDKDEKNIQSKTTLTTDNLETLNKPNETDKEIHKTENVALKEEHAVKEKPVVPVDNSDIKIKTNLPPKEITRSNVFVDKEASPIQAKQPAPAIEKPEIKIKPIDPPKEIKKTFSEALKEEAIAKSTPQAPIVAKPEIKIKSNLPVKEGFKKDFVAAKIENVNPIKNAAPIEEKAVVDLKTNDAPIQKEEIKPQISKSEEAFKQIKPTVDRSNLKIRETVFTENVKKAEEVKKVTVAPIVDPVSNLTQSINVDEIISKIDEEKVEPVKLSEAESYEKEIIKLRKKLKRNILVSAALFAVLAAASVFVYFNFMQTPVKVVGSTTRSSEKINFAGQTSLVLNTDFKPPIETENAIVENGSNTTETAVTKETMIGKKDIIVPLPEISTKEESTLFASNVKEDLTSTEIVPTQTAAAKTETVVPPKEIKKVEEEPAFFVAVEEMPELIGGIKGLQGKIVYPEIAKRVGVEGKVIVQAIVDENGKVVSVNTVKGIGSGCDEVAMDAVRNSKFVPGKQRGKNVSVQVTIPIVFKK